MVEALRYKQEGRGFVVWCLRIIQVETCCVFSASLFRFTREVELLHCHLVLSHNSRSISHIFDRADCKNMALWKRVNYEHYITFQPCIQKDDSNGRLVSPATLSAAECSDRCMDVARS